MQSTCTQTTDRLPALERTQGPRTALSNDVDPAIRIRGLRMTYGAVEAVRGIDLDIHHGEIFALLGPNGAGKTTTVEILEGFRHRTGGEVRVLGEDPERAGGAWRARLGMVLQESEPEPGLTVRECLTLYAGYYPAPRAVEETLELVGLREKAGALCRALSGGQRRRLDVAIALIGDPELIFLDEPTTGFDPSARRATWELIAGLRALEKTIVLTTHYLEEAEFLADRIAVIAAGRIVAQGDPATLGGRDGAAARVSFSLPAQAGMAALPLDVLSLADVAPDGRVTLQSSRPLPLLGSLAAWAAANDLGLPDLQVTRPTLEEIYLRLTAGN